MAGKTNIDWDAIKQAFVMDAGLAGDQATFGRLSKRFGVSKSAISQEANKLNDNGDNWFDIRQEKMDSLMDKADRDAIRKIKVSRRSFSSKLGEIIDMGLDSIIQTLKETKGKGLSVKDVVSLAKAKRELDDKLLPSAAGSMIFIKAPEKNVEDMNEEELIAYKKKLDDARKLNNCEYEVIQDESEIEPEDKKVVKYEQE